MYVHQSAIPSQQAYMFHYQILVAILDICATSTTQFHRHRGKCIGKEQHSFGTLKEKKGIPQFKNKTTSLNA